MGDIDVHDVAVNFVIYLSLHWETPSLKVSMSVVGFKDEMFMTSNIFIAGVRPYKCQQCGKAFTQRCSLESHSRKVHNYNFAFAYKERRRKLYVCEDCGHTTSDPGVHYLHLKNFHPQSPVLLKFYDKRQFKFAEEEEEAKRAAAAMQY